MCFVPGFTDADVASRRQLSWSTWMIVGLWLLGTAGMLYANFQIQVISLRPVHKLMYSASVVERATTSRWLATQDTGAPLIITRQSLPEFFVVKSPAQSASACAVGTSASPRLPYLKPKWWVLKIYFITGCTATQRISLGLWSKVASVHMK